jgi:hypothetical protein
MKKAVLLLFILLCTVPTFAQVAFAPVTLQFPHIVVGGDPGGLNYVTIVQAVNNNSTFSLGHISVYSDTGTPMTASFDGGAPSTTDDFEVDSGSTRQIVISSTGAVAVGWISIIYNNTDDPTTVLVQYRAGTSVLTEVGINGFYQPITFTDFAVETGPSLNAGIAIANPNPAAWVLVRLWDPSNPGNLLGSTIVPLPQNGHIAKNLNELFPSVASIGQILTQVSLDSCGTSTCSTGGPGLIATALRLNLNNNSFTAIPVIESPPSGVDVVRLVPQIAVGGANGVSFQTALYLTTSATGGVTGVANIFDGNGNPISVSANGGTPSSQFTFTILTNSVNKIVLSSNSAAQVGWVQLTLPQSESLIVNAVYDTLNGPTVVSETGVLESPAITGGLIYADQAGVESIGLAFANPQSTSNSVTLTLYNQAGFAADTQTVTLPPFGHSSAHLYEIFPSLNSGSTFTGSVSMQAPLGFSVVALRQTGTDFASIPVAQTIMFVPSITGLGVSATNRTTGTVSFTISVTDFTPNVVTPTSTAVTIGAGVLYNNSNGFDGYYQVLVNGASLLNAQSGTLTGTFQGNVSNIPSGTQATFFIFLQDALGNSSNTASVPIKF